MKRLIVWNTNLKKQSRNTKRMLFFTIASIKTFTFLDTIVFVNITLGSHGIFLRDWTAMGALFQTEIWRVQAPGLR